MYAEEDGSIRTIDEAMHAYYKDEAKLKWDTNLLQYASDENK